MSEFRKCNICFLEVPAHIHCISFSFSLDYYHHKDKKHNSIDIKRVFNEHVDRSYPCSVTLASNEDTNQAGIRKHRAYAKEEDIQTMMDMMLLADLDNVNELSLMKYNIYSSFLNII